MAASTTVRSSTRSSFIGAPQAGREAIAARLDAAEAEILSICPFDAELRVAQIAQSAHAVARDLLAAARTAGWVPEAIRCLLLMARTYLQNDPGRAEKLAELVREEARRAGQEQLRCDAVRLVAGARVLQGDLEHGERLTREAMEGFRRIGDRHGELRCLWILHEIEFGLGRRDHELVILTTMLAQPEIVDYAILHFYLHCCIARLLTKARPEDPTIAVHLDEADRLTAASANPCARICYYQARVEFLLNRKQVESAMALSLECLELARRYHALEGEAFALTLLAWCHESLGQEQERRRCLEESLRLGRIVGNKGAVAVALLNRAVGVLNDQHDEVRRDLEEALAAARSDANAELELEASKWLAEKLEASGDAAAAVHHLHRYIELQQQMRAMAFDHALRAIDLERRVASTERAITELSERSRQLQDELEKQASETANKSAALADQAGLIRNVHTIFRQVLEDAGTPREIVEELRRRFGRISLPELEWQQVSDEFVRIFPDFLMSLRERIPSVTRSEERVCCLVRLGLMTHEIANLLNITERGVETSRLRIRRKAQLTSRTSLQEYLSGI
jgi:DNA-binding NarL/FixJ family response regulator